MATADVADAVAQQAIDSSSTRTKRAPHRRLHARRLHRSASGRVDHRAIARLNLFVALFLLLALRQAYVIVAAPSLAARASNPRHGLLDARRGRILATDGTVLAATTAGKRVYPFGASLAHTIGYASSRYGTSGLEDAYDRALTPPETTGDPMTQVQSIVAAFGGKTNDAHGADVVTTIVPAIQKELYARLSQQTRGAGVVLDPRTGAVLAIASVPSFDPNSIDAIFAGLNTDTSSPLLDRSIDGLPIRPGSTFTDLHAAARLSTRNRSN